MRTYLRRLLVCLAVLMLLSCTRDPAPLQPTTSPLLSPLATLTRHDTSPSTASDQPGESALTAYPVAQARARQWRDGALLYEISPRVQMAANLGLPVITSGWFFMFKEPGGPVEFYVYIVEGEVSGFTEAQPILAEQLPYARLAIEVDELRLDSTDALAALLSTDDGQRWAAARADTGIPTRLDFRLVHLQGQPDPIWTVFSAESDRLDPLYHVNAITGVEAADPFR